MKIPDPPDYGDIPPPGDEDLDHTERFASTSPAEPVGVAEWPEPRALDNRLYSVPTFDPPMLPESLRAFCTDIARRMSCSLVMVVVPLIVALSSVIGRRCCVRPKQYDTWTVVPNLWGVVVARPGGKKSPAMKAAIEPLTKLEKDAHAKRAKKQGHGKRYKITDSTPEKLIVIMRDNPHGVALVRDELTGLFAQWRKQGREGERQLFIESWAGNADHTTDRIKRGTVRADYVCLSILGTIQPDPLARHVRATVNGGDDNDGMLARFQLMVYPDRLPSEYVDEPPDVVARQRAFRIFKRLDAITRLDIARDDQEPNEPPFLRFDSEAQAIAVQYFQALEKSLDDPCELDALLSHFSKYRSLFPSLALILELAEWAAEPDPEPISAISKHSALLASQWCEFLSEHARRVYGLATMGPESPGALLATKIQGGKLGRSFTARELRRKCWSGLRGKAVDDALVTLEEWGWIRKTPPRLGPGRPSDSYDVNPRVMIRRESR